METSSFAAHQRRKSVHDDDARKRGSSKPISNGMRRSCDPCRRRKKKCDGGRPCRRCLGARGECAYSMRRWHQNQQRQQTRGPSGLHPSQVGQYLTSEAARAQGMLLLKRCRLSASPATGLVGMQENTFLSDFFGCIGFMPFTTRSYIREALVKLMATPVIFQQPGAVPYHGAGVGYSYTAATEDACGTTSGATDSSGCIFWCAVALGALAKGYPIESVSRYCQLARDGLNSSSGPVNAEKATAWAILAYLYLFCGNTDKFQEYLTLPQSFLSKSIEQGSSETLPVGFAEIVDHKMTVKVCCGEVDTDEMESFCAQVKAPPKLNAAATESELYTLVMRSFRMFEQAVYGAAYSRSESTTFSEGLTDVERNHEGSQVNPQLLGPSDEVLDAMIVRIKKYPCQVECLEDAVDRPSIRSGIGGLIINGNLFFDKAAKGDLCGSLERLGRSVEVFERFPGLCRLTMGAHAAHIMITALATMDGCKARELYHTLRTSYNSARLPGAAPLPPLEEWQGISPCCEYFYCRTMERLLLSKEMGISSNSIDNGIHCQDSINGEGDKSFGGEKQINGLRFTNSVSEGANIPTNPFRSSFNRMELDLPSMYEANPGYCPPDDRGDHRRVTQSLAPTSLFEPHGEMPAALNADLGGNATPVNGRIIDAGEVALAPEALTVNPEIIEWSGVEDGTGNKYRLDAEDWLDAAHTLSDTVAVPCT